MISKPVFGNFSFGNARSNMKNRLLFTLLSGLSCLVMPFDVRSEEPGSSNELMDLNLEDLMKIKVQTTSTVSRVDEHIDEAPGSVYVFTRRNIQESGYHSLRELLQTVPSFTVFQRDLDYVAGVRGLNANDNEKISLLINGQLLNQVNEPSYLNGPINLDNVERVEVVVGPSSLFQQANTLAATINIITKNTDGVEAISSLGVNGSNSQTLLGGKKWSYDEYVNVSTTFEDKEGYRAWRENYAPNIADKSLSGKLDQPSFFSVVNGRLGEVKSQFVAYRSNFPEQNIDFSSKLNRGKYVDQFYTGFLEDTHPWSNDFQSIARVATTYKNVGRTNKDGLPEPGSALLLSITQLTSDSELAGRYTGFKGQTLQAGVQFYYDDNLDNFYEDDFSSPATYGKRVPLFNRDSNAFGFYLDDTARLTDKFKVIGGVRADQNTRLESDQWYPGWRTAAVYNPTENWTSKLVFNRAVRMPSTLAAMNTAWGKDNPDSPDWASISSVAKSPEKLTTTEWQNIYYAAHTRFSINIYHEYLSDFISWYAPTTNIGNFHGNGIEIAAKAPLSPSFDIWGNTSFSDSKLKTSDQILLAGPIDSSGRIAGAPQYLANLGLTYRPSETVSLSPALRYFTKQTAYDSVVLQNITINNRVYFDATLAWYNFTGVDTDFRFTGQNLFNDRSLVAGQWGNDLQRPQGLTGLFTIEQKF